MLSAVFLQVVQKTPLPFFATSLSLSAGAQLMVVGFAGELLVDRLVLFWGMANWLSCSSPLCLGAPSL